MPEALDTFSKITFKIGVILSKIAKLVVDNFESALLYFYQRLGMQSWTDQQIDKAIKVIPTHGRLLFTEIQKILENNSLPVDIAYYLIFYKYIPMPFYILALVEAVRSRGLL